MPAMLADLGNSRLKWARPRGDGISLDVVALPVDNADAWTAAWYRWGLDRAPSDWWISTVNPRIEPRLDAFLRERAGVTIRWFRSVADVPVAHELTRVETAGTDRGFAVLGALAGRSHVGDQPGVVISCGSAITVERISPLGVWQGGAIAPGLRLAAQALNAMTAQLPLVHPLEPPPGWGRSTVPALEAGVFWGTVGSIRALVDRQRADLDARPWVVWTGGDAEFLAGPTALDLDDVRVAPSLVLEGLHAARGG